MMGFYHSRIMIIGRVLIKCIIVFPVRYKFIDSGTMILTTLAYRCWAEHQDVLMWLEIESFLIIFSFFSDSICFCSYSVLNGCVCGKKCDCVSCLRYHIREKEQWLVNSFISRKTIYIQIWYFLWCNPYPSWFNGYHTS